MFYLFIVFLITFLLSLGPLSYIEDIPEPVQTGVLVWGMLSLILGTFCGSFLLVSLLLPEWFSAGVAFFITLSVLLLVYSFAAGPEGSDD